jgi:outer membrane usher protein FimD/PapC
VTRRFGDLLVSVIGSYDQRSFGDDDFGVSVFLSRPLGRRHTATASYVSRTETAAVEVRRRASLDLPDLEYAIRAEASPSEQEFTGTATYTTARFQADVDVLQLVPEGDLRPDQQAASVRLQSGIAFVDGRFGVGRNPAVASRWSAVTPPCEGRRSRFRLAAIGRVLASADAFGPAVVETISPYQPYDIRVNVSGGPVAMISVKGAMSSNLAPGPGSGSKLVATTIGPLSPSSPWTGRRWRSPPDAW